MDLSAYIQQAYDGGAYSYLLEMLRSEYFQESDVSYELLWMVEDLSRFLVEHLLCPFLGDALFIMVSQN